MTEPTSESSVHNDHTDSAQIPQATVVLKKKHRSFSIIWLIPIIAAIIGGWLAVHSIINQGPTITITFRSAEGLEAGRTKIKYRDVDVGVVQSIKLASDSKSGVEVTAKLDKQAEAFLLKDTRFWVVKPRFAGGGLSGLGTLLSGAYIGLEVGHDSEAKFQFDGLEVPPILTSGLPGKTFKLRANDLGSIDYGTPIYYRRIPVGEVIAYKLDQDGQSISVDVFVHAPYDQYVTQDTRFWAASGADVPLGAAGVQINTESLSSILLGGLAFADPPHSDPLPPAPQDSIYSLHSDRTEAFKQQDSTAEIYKMVFRESVHGLTVGAPVEFRGIPLGEVIKIGVDFDREAREVNIPVLVRLYPDRLLDMMGNIGENTEKQRFENVKILISNGMRAQLRTGSLITGQLYIALDFFPRAPKVSLDMNAKPRTVPTITGGLQELQSSINSIVNKLDKIPFEQLGKDLHETVSSLNSAIKNANKLIERVDKDIAPELIQTLNQAQATLERSGKLLAQDSPTQQELRSTLQEVSRAAQSVRALTDYLERHPEALIRGKAAEN